MSMAFDENVQERDCTVIFEFNGEFNICVTVIEVVQKLSFYTTCCVFTVVQGEAQYRQRIETKSKGERCY